MTIPQQTPTATLRLVSLAVRHQAAAQAAWQTAENELFALRGAILTAQAERNRSEEKVKQLVDGNQIRHIRNLLNEVDRLSGHKESAITAAARAFLAGLEVLT